MTAKYWGRGPTAWTGGIVRILTTNNHDVTSPGAPACILSPSAAQSPESLPQAQGIVKPPTSLCRWTIHVRDLEYYQPLLDPVQELDDTFDALDASSWRPWSNEQRQGASLPQAMSDSLIESTFSSLPPEDLPISHQAVTESLQRDPRLLLLDACKFAIMAGNVDAMTDLIENDEGDVPDLRDIHPFHLAAEHLDGGNTCCLVFSKLANNLDPKGYFVNQMDHTVLDSLLLSILRSHTNVSLNQVNPALAETARFPGEEKDICGRWDADTPAVQELLHHGYHRIPRPWKHPFCHTAVQAVCHSAIALFGPQHGPKIDTATSGLFVRRCVNCGLSLKLGPLHAIVVVAFYLAQMGMEGETLFGPLALLVCILRLGGDASLTANVSVDEIFGVTDLEQCSHGARKPMDLILAVPSRLVHRWSEACQTGWRCILQTLLLAEKGSIRGATGKTHPAKSTDGAFDISECDNRDRAEETGLERDTDFDSDTDTPPEYGCCPDSLSADFRHSADALDLPWGNGELGLLWATIQVEFLTYRRIKEGDPWISDRFPMRALLMWLEGEENEFRTEILSRHLMGEVSRCGWFDGQDFACPIAEEATREHIMNMDVYDRTTFIARPNFADRWVESFM
jgi:hypothetical protein